MPAIIGMASATTWRGMEPVLRSFMRRCSGKGAHGINAPASRRESGSADHGIQGPMNARHLAAGLLAGLALAACDLRYAVLGFPQPEVTAAQLPLELAYREAKGG